MVTIVGYKECISSENKLFYSLQLQGDVTIATSESGNVYLTANKASIMTSFTEEYCISLIGKQLPGHLEKVPCQEYEYTTSSGEKITLDYRYQYFADEETAQSQISIPVAKQMQTTSNAPIKPTFVDIKE